MTRIEPQANLVSRIADITKVQRTQLWRNFSVDMQRSVMQLGFRSGDMAVSIRHEMRRDRFRAKCVAPESIDSKSVYEIRREMNDAIYAEVERLGHPFTPFSISQVISAEIDSILYGRCSFDIEKIIDGWRLSEVYGSRYGIEFSAILEVK